MIAKPEPGEHHPYFQRYIDLVGEGEFLSLLRENTRQTEQFFGNLPVEKQDYRYAPGKWTPKEVLMHVTDMERVFAYRALVGVRGEGVTALHSVDENVVAEHVDVSGRTMKSVVDEFLVVRRNSEIIFEHTTDAQSKFMANGIPHKVSPRALGYMIIGHALHHIRVIGERYL